MTPCRGAVDAVQARAGLTPLPRTLTQPQLREAIQRERRLDFTRPAAPPPGS